MNKTSRIFINALPLVLMIGLIPFVPNEIGLAVIYLAIIGLSLKLRYEAQDFMLLVFGFFVMILSESFFVRTGVETFTRRGLFGLMPIWLPILWAYAFVAMKRAIKILER